MHHSEIKAEIRKLIADGTVVPAHPLALDANRALDVRHQRALTRYYLDAGAGGLAVGVHTTQFAIRDVGLYRPVLELAAETAASWTKRPVAMVAGLAGPTQQAVAEAQTARGSAIMLACSALRRCRMRKMTCCSRTVRPSPHASPSLASICSPPSGAQSSAPISGAGSLQIPAVIAIKIAPFNRYRTLDVLRAVATPGVTTSRSIPAMTITSCSI